MDVGTGEEEEKKASFILCDNLRDIGVKKADGKLKLSWRNNFGGYFSRNLHLIIFKMILRASNFAPIDLMIVTKDEKFSTLKMTIIEIHHVTISEYYCIYWKLRANQKNQRGEKNTCKLCTLSDGNSGRYLFSLHWSSHF